MRAEASRLTKGFRFEDRYEILGELGAGSFASVYEARQLSTGQSVAIKLLAERERAGRKVGRFRREMEICAALSHPNIVGLIDSGETASGQLYAVFAHVPGETLAQALEREGALGVGEALRLMTQALEALAAAHAKGIVHRDLKPANLMLSSGGVRRSAMVLDFGLGAMAEERRRQEWERLTQSREFLGTPLYAAPEQLEGEEPGERSDLYSWGLIFLECLTGEHPFAERGALARLVAGGGEVVIPPWLHEHRLGELLARVTTREPERRDVTAESLLAELEAIAGGELPVAPEAPARTDGGEARRPSSGSGPQHQLSAILSADVFGYSRLMADDEDSTVRMIRAYRQQIEGLVRQRRGRMEFTGDNFLAEFRSAIEAVHCALEIQRLAEKLNVDLPADRRMEFRMGIHLGDVRFEGGRLFGTGVNIAARLEGLAEPGGLCISGAVREQLHGKIRLELEDLGEQSLKNIPVPVHAFRVRREGEAGETPSAVERPPRRRWTLLRRPGIAAAVALAFVIGGGAAAWVYSLYEDATTTYSVAVLPFVGLSPDEETGVFARGLSENILDLLVQRESRPIRNYGQLPFPIGKLDVASRTASFQFADRGDDLSTLAEALGVAYVLEGSVQRMGESLHVTVQLFRARDGFHVWSKSYDGAFADRFELQEAIARNVASVAASEVKADIDRRYAFWGALGLGTSTAAMRYYLDASNQWRLMNLGEGGDWVLREKLLRKAVEADPEFYPAWLELAYAYRTRVGRTMPRREAFAAARAALERASELNPDSQGVRMQLGHLYMDLGDYANAEASYRWVADRFPRDTWSHAGLANVALCEGRTDDALRLMATASTTIDGRINRHEEAVFLHLYAWHLLVAGDYERALGVGASRVERQHVFPNEAVTDLPEEAPTLQAATRRFQAKLVQKVLEEAGWNVSEAARRLDVARSHIYKLISAFGLERKER